MIAQVRRNGWKIVADLAINIGLPYAIFVWATPSAGDVKALLLSMIPPLAWGLGAFARDRRVDLISIFSLGGIALSLLAAAGGGSVRWLQLRENLVSGVFALAFLISAAVGKPLIYELARATKRRSAAADAAAFEQLGTNPYVRRSMLVMTVVWGAALLVQTALACALVFVIPIATYLIVSPVLAYGTMGLLALWSVWYVKRQQRIGRERAQRTRE